ncbi:MAG: hypothetical protein PG981_000851 [Wolbachia endosymbiont of Ctenocephalides orientis wCori]|nr:MAG: hypothetical protein PG981_000851 [Wolbachia endosymbiont of Ctenocephalides orientis wCori]
MTQNKETLKRYALEFIRESGGTITLNNLYFIAIHKAI